jgi:hypothetical protein
VVRKVETTTSNEAPASAEETKTEE